MVNVEDVDKESVVSLSNSQCSSTSSKGGTIVDSLHAKTPYERSNPKQKEFEKNVAIWMFDQMQPYSIVEKESFRRMIRRIDQRLVILSEKIYRTEIMPTMYEKLFNFMKDFVNNNVVWCGAVWSGV